MGHKILPSRNMHFKEKYTLKLLKILIPDWLSDHITRDLLARLKLAAKETILQSSCLNT